MPTYAVSLPTLHFASPLISAGFLTSQYTANCQSGSDSELMKPLANMQGEHVEFIMKNRDRLSARMGIIKGMETNYNGDECLAVYYLENKGQGKKFTAHIPSSLLHCVKLAETAPNIESRRRWLDTVTNLKGITTLFQGNEAAAYSLAGKAQNICNIFDSASRVQGEVAENLPIPALLSTDNQTGTLHLGDLVRLSESTKSAVARSFNTTINPRTNKHGAKMQIVSGAIQSLKYDIFSPTGPIVYCIARTEPSFLDAASMINDSYVQRCGREDLIISDNLLTLKPAGIDICAWYR